MNTKLIHWLQQTYKKLVFINIKISLEFLIEVENLIKINSLKASRYLKLKHRFSFNKNP